MSTTTRRPATAADLGIRPTGERFYAARADGRYRVIDGDLIDARTDGDAPGSAYVATAASRAKAEAKAAQFNAEHAAAAAEEQAHAEMMDARAEEQATAETAAPAAEATARVRVGLRLADAVQAATALTLGDTLRAKLAAKAPNGDGVRVVHLTATERAALGQVCANVEATAREAVAAGDRAAVSLVFSAQATLRQLAAV